MDIQAQAKEIVLKHAKEMALELVEIVAIPALEEAALKSETKVDDVVLAAIKEPLKIALKEMVSKI